MQQLKLRHSAPGCNGDEGRKQPTKTKNETGVITENDEASSECQGEDAMLFTYHEGTAALQTEKDVVVVDHSGAERLMSVRISIAIRGLTCDSRHIIVWNKSEIYVYAIFDSHIELATELQLPSGVTSLSLFQDSLCIASDAQLLVNNLKGVLRSSADFTSTEGKPTLLSSANMNGSLVVISENGALKLFDVSNELKLLHPTKHLHELVGDGFIGQAISVQCNATASLVSIVTHQEKITRLYVLNVLKNELQLIHCDDSSHRILHFWDPADQRIIACDVSMSNDPATFEGKEQDDNRRTDPKVLIFFVDEESGCICQHESIPHENTSSLIGINVPHVVFAQDGKVTNHVLADFIGLENESPLVLAAMIDFCFYSRLGDIDKSFEALHAIRSPNVWSNLAPICIDMRRLDLTELCLTHAVSRERLAAFNLAKEQPEVEVALAEAAAEFGLYDTAERLLIECKRYDTLNQLMQRLGRWDSALRVAENHDRLHLDLTKYRYAKFLEESGDIDLAADVWGKYAKKSAKLDLLIKQRRLQELENFVTQRNDKQLTSWFGDFNQSIGNYSKARDCYLLSGDDFKLVDLYCSAGNFEEALRTVEEGGNAAAAYHLAKFCSPRDAVKLYCLGEMYNHAIRVAISNGFDTDILVMAKKCTPQQASSCARYFEKKGSYENACALFRRCGQTLKALTVCLAAIDGRTEEENIEMMRELILLVRELDGRIPSIISAKVVDRLNRAGESDLAVHVICFNATDGHSCLDRCVQEGATMTEELVDRIMSISGIESKDVLRRIAIRCDELGDRRLACTLFTRLGERKMAMKCLVREGDAGAIIAYTVDSDCGELYVLAANHLRKLNISDDANVEESIILFYSKAEKYDKMVSYCISQSQVCVEERGDYDWAIKLLKKASAVLPKMTDDPAVVEIKRLIGERVSTMEWFVYTKASLDSMDGGSLESLCDDLLSPGANRVVREGDCYALLVNFYVSCGRIDKAYEKVRHMESRKLDVGRFIDVSIVEDILRHDRL